jgi:hypothetical protein
MRAIVHAARQVDSHYFFGGLIDTQMQLSPGASPTFSPAVLADVPLISAKDLQTGGVNHYMPGLPRRMELWRQPEPGLATTYGRVSGHGEVDSHEANHRVEESLRGSQA